MFLLGSMSCPAFAGRHRGLPVALAGEESAAAEVLRGGGELMGRRKPLRRHGCDRDQLRSDPGQQVSQNNTALENTEARKAGVAPHSLLWLKSSAVPST